MNLYQFHNIRDVRFSSAVDVFSHASWMVKEIVEEEFGVCPELLEINIFPD